ncbi:ditrans,Cpolycis-undecaprenyl-diphosphate synthase ((2E,6E)-farnesyl-diphosphate specific) [Spirochaetota bacterium]|nr:ditrans,Cpolycis-undecaprenyl-diphosphate synthase ((2E,6E)-farnesyl-diphosphate specific) [Spirochaetota bacterium]
MKIPHHIAFIPDGNGRWAQAHHLPIEVGHRRGVETLTTILDQCYHLGIKVVTVYAFSSENWSRSEHEKNILFGLINFFLKTKLPKLIDQSVKVKIIGQQDKFPSSVKENIQVAETATQAFTTYTLQIALGYGGREEIIHAAQKFADAVVRGEQSISALDETHFRSYLSTKNIADPDLVIRTSGEYRISNFMLYQLAYSEFYFTSTLWPDFTLETLDAALKAFSTRNRRFGSRPLTSNDNPTTAHNHIISNSSHRSS